MSEPRHTLQLFDASDYAIQPPGGFQNFGWASPTNIEFPELFLGAAREELSSTGSALVDHQTGPSKEDLAAKNSCLKARIARLSQVESASPPKTPLRTVQSKCQPRKRTASSATDIGSSPAKRPRQATTPSSSSISEEPIEALWSPVVTLGQRSAAFEGDATPKTPKSVTMASSEYTSSPQDYLSGPSAAPETPSTPARKPAPKKARASKKASAAKSAPKQSFTAAGAPAPPLRPVAALYQQNFLSMEPSEKIRILLPLIQGLDPNTGKKWAEPGTLGLELMAADQQAPTHTPTINAALELAANVPSNSGFDIWFKALQASVAQNAPEQSESFSMTGFGSNMQPPNDQTSTIQEDDINALMDFIGVGAEDAHIEQTSAENATNIGSNAQDIQEDFGSDQQSSFDQSPESDAESSQRDAANLVDEQSCADDESAHGEDQPASDETFTMQSANDDIFTLGGAQSISDNTPTFDNAHTSSSDMFDLGGAQTTSDDLFNLLDTAPTPNDTFNFGLGQFSATDKFSFGTDPFTPADTSSFNTDHSTPADSSYGTQQFTPVDSSSYGGDHFNNGTPFSLADEQFNTAGSNTFGTDAFNTGASYPMTNDHYSTADSNAFVNGQYTAADTLDFFNATFSGDPSSTNTLFTNEDYFSNGIAAASPSAGFGIDSAPTGFGADSPSTGYANEALAQEMNELSASVDGAACQREALEKYARRVAEGRRR